MNLLPLHAQFSKFLELERQRTIRTIKTYEKNFDYFIEWLEANDYSTSLDSLQFPIIKDYMYYMRESGLDQNTVRLRMVSLNSFLDFLVNWDYLEKNPIKGKLHYAKKKISMNNCINIDELENLLNVPDELYRKTGREHYFQGAVMLRTMLYTGVRRGGLLGLNWEHIDLTNNSLLVKIKGGEIKKFPVTEKLKERLLALKKLRGAISGPVFLGVRSKKRLTETQLTYEFKFYCKLAGIQSKFRIHDMRHQCATYLVDNGMPVEQVKEVLGHKDINSTMIYYHGNTGKLKRAMDAAFSRL